jgi:dsRNA-specific ribonuclease
VSRSALSILEDCGIHYASNLDPIIEHRDPLHVPRTKLNTLAQYAKLTSPDTRVVAVLDSRKKAEFVAAKIGWRLFGGGEQVNGDDSWVGITCASDELDLVVGVCGNVGIVIVFDIGVLDQGFFRKCKEFAARKSAAVIAFFEPEKKEHVLAIQMISFFDLGVDDAKNKSLEWNLQSQQISLDAKAVKGKPLMIPEKKSKAVLPTQNALERIGSPKLPALEKSASSEQGHSKYSSTAIDTVPPNKYKSAVPKAFDPCLWKSVEDFEPLQDGTFYSYLIVTQQPFHRFANEGIEGRQTVFKKEIGFAIITKIQVPINEYEFDLHFPDPSLHSSCSVRFVPTPTEAGKFAITSKEQYRVVCEFQKKFCDLLFKIGSQLKPVNLGSSVKKYMIAPVRYEYGKKEGEHTRLQRYEVDWKFMYEIIDDESNDFYRSFMNTLSTLPKDQDFLSSAFVASKDIFENCWFGRSAPNEEMLAQNSMEDYLNHVFKNMIIRSKENSIRYMGYRIRTDLTPASPLPTGAIKKKGVVLTTFEDYYKFKHGKSVNLNQPILEVRNLKIPNMLKPSDTSKTSEEATVVNTNSHVYLIPETVEIDPISVRHVRAGRALFSILHRFDIYVAAEELRANLSLPLSIKSSSLIEAITAPCSDDLYNYERLETLGDAFLKLAVACDLYTKHQRESEISLSKDRVKKINNRNLYDMAIKLGIEAYIKTKQFHQKDFYPPGCDPFLYRESDGSDIDILLDEKEQTLPMKMIADVTEALIGAAVLDGGVETSLDLLKQLEMITLDFAECAELTQSALSVTKLQKQGSSESSNEFKLTYQWTENPKGALYEYGVRLLKSPPITDYESYPNGSFKAMVRLQLSVNDVISSEAVSNNKRSAEKLACSKICEKLFKSNELKVESKYSEFEELLNYKFKNQNILKQSLCHSSVKNPEHGNFESLEFLGDAVLDWIVTFGLFSLYKDLTPEGITRLRALIVCNQTYSYMAFKSMHLHKYLNHELDSDSWNSLVDKAERTVKAVSDIRLLGDEKYIISKIFSDCFEGIAGAVFVDSGFSLPTAAQVFDPFLRALFDAAEQYIASGVI